MSHKPISQPLSTPVLTERLKQLNAKLQEVLRPIYLQDYEAE